jgi:hypothetical protein
MSGIAGRGDMETLWNLVQKLLVVHRQRLLCQLIDPLEKESVDK